MPEPRVPGTEDTISASQADVGTASTGVDATAAAPGPRSPAPARLGRYELLGELGAGGMGVVYQGRDPTLGRPLAIKLIRPRAGGAEGRARFLREAQAMARLHHPNVVPVFDVGEADGQVYLVMPLLPGGTLATWLRAAPRPWREVVDRFAAAARGLAAAHAAGMIHRDFKPENVLVGEGGEVQVADFGLARLGAEEVALAATGAAEAVDVTRAGTVLGTPVYMAPEQLRGGEVDRRADVFAFCVSLYEGLYGQRPFTVPDGARGQAALDELLARIEAGRIEPPPRDRDVPGWLHAIVVRGLAPAPADRWPTIDAVLAALERRRPSRRDRWLAAASLALVGIGVALALATRGDRGDARPALADDTDDGLAARCDAREGAACAALAARLGRRLDAPDAPAEFRLALAACDLDAAEGCARAASLLERAHGVQGDDARARTLAERACELGSARGCAAAAGLLRSGIGGAIDAERAAARLARACDLGDPMACRLRARRLRTDLDAPDPDGARRSEARAVELARAGCDGGDPTDCRTLGLLHHAGVGVDKDAGRGAVLLDKACADGDAYACADIGQLYVLGDGVQADAARGLDLLRRGCAGGVPESCEAVGVVLQNGFGLPVDHAGARRVAEEQCKRGGARQCRGLAALYMQGVGVPQDVVRARRLYGDACDAGDSTSCFLVGSTLAKTDPEGALAVLRRSCDLDDALGCAELGELALARGDDALAARAYRAACSIDNAQSCAGLARLLFEGRGVEADPPRARALLERGCDATDALACLDLARRLRDGDGVPADARAAVDRYVAACDHGFGKGCLAAADLLSTGAGLPADPTRAAELRTRGCEREPRLCETR